MVQKGTTSMKVNLNLVYVIPVPCRKKILTCSGPKPAFCSMCWEFAQWGHKAPEVRSWTIHFHPAVNLIMISRVQAANMTHERVKQVKEAHYAQPTQAGIFVTNCTLSTQKSVLQKHILLKSCKLQESGHYNEMMIMHETGSTVNFMRNSDNGKAT
jgi:hypothetical protein